MRLTLLVACLWLAASSLQGKIVFYSKRDGNAEIYTMDSNGSNKTRLTFNETSDSFPAWSPNGRQIMFESTRDGNWEIYVMDADGSNPRNLTRHPENDSFPDWSPDGSQIAFNSFRDGAINLYTMAADGSNVKQLTHMRIEHWELASKPRWSPDGKWILFEGSIDQGRQIYAIRPDGTGRWRVSEPVPRASMFLGDWSPDGKQVLYKGTIDANVRNSFAIIATLDPIGRSKVKKWEEVPLPKMPVRTVSFGVDGKSIFFSGMKDLHWNIFRFRLDTHELIQLTDHIWEDTHVHEWDPRLSVPPQQGLLPKHWGEIKSAPIRSGFKATLLRHRGSATRFQGD